MGDDTESLYGRFEGPLKHLSGNGSTEDKSLAALSIALMCNEGTVPDNIETSTAIHNALYAAMKEDKSVQINALLAIKTLATLSPLFPRTTTHQDLQDLQGLSTGQKDERITAGAMAALCAYSRLDTDEYRPIIQSLFDNKVLAHALSVSVKSTEPSVQLASVDCVAALISNGLINFKPQAFESDISKNMVESLSQYAGKKEYEEVQLLRLLVLGMMIGEDDLGQEYVASSPSAITCLLGYMRRHDDADLQILSSDIFKLLSTKDHLKEPLSQSMRRAHDASSS